MVPEDPYRGLGNWPDKATIKIDSKYINDRIYDAYGKEYFDLRVLDGAVIIADDKNDNGIIETGEIEISV